MSENFTDPEQKKLRQALAGASMLSDVCIPKSCDQAVLEMIDCKVAEIKRARSKGKIVRLFAGASALAAAILLVVMLLAPFALDKKTGDRVTRSPDIVDVYLLACKIESKAKSSPEDDFNKDGRVDEKDIEDMAQKAVSVSSVEKEKGA